MHSFAFLTFATLLARVSATNDWSKPCFDGTCEYDIQGTEESPLSGSLKIWGAATAIADITPAGGWDITGCSTDTLDQDISLVCTEGREDDCQKLSDGSGAVGKVVRLPESCGLGPFATVTRSWTPQNQTLSSGTSRTRRDGSTPQVKALHLASFGSTTNSVTGGSTAVQPVNFAIEVSNVQAAVQSPPTISGRGSISTRVLPRRGLLDSIKSGIDKIADAVGDAVDDANTVNLNKTLDLPPLNVDKTFNLIDQSVSCPPASLSLKVDVDAQAYANASLGVVASGTIVPPKIDSFSVITGLSADIDGTINLAAGVTGTLDSGRITLFEVGIPGLTVPGIFSIGPSFQIDAQAKASLEVNLNTSITMKYTVKDSLSAFPPQSGIKPSGSFDIGDSPLQLSLNPGSNGTGTLEAHLIPSLNLGIEAFSNITTAKIFLELDASATMELTGAATASTLIKRGTKSPPIAPHSTKSAAPASTSPCSNPPSAKRPKTTPSLIKVPSKPSAANTTSDAQFNGCFSIDSGFVVQAGATADFFGLFDQSTTVPLFNRNFELFRRCFGTEADKTAPAPALPTALNPRDHEFGATGAARPFGLLNTRQPDSDRPFDVKSSGDGSRPFSVGSSSARRSRLNRRGDRPFVVNGAPSHSGRRAVDASDLICPILQNLGDPLAIVNEVVNRAIIKEL